MADDDRPPPRTHTFKKVNRLLDDFFKVDEYRGSFERYDNTMSPEQRLLVFERGDSVAALLYDPYYREVILVEQFRLPTIANGHGWILEPAAGMIRPGDTARATIIRELREETGYQVNSVAPIATFYVSPGGSSERIHLFYAEVRRTQQDDKGGGILEDGEDIRIVRMPIATFFDKLRDQEFEDAKLIIAAQWLWQRHARLPAEEATHLQPIERTVRHSKPLPRWMKNSRKIVGYMCGNILHVRDVDVWVNPLSTDMMLDRFSDRTVSAAIRMSGAEKYPATKRIKRDTIGEELRLVMGRRNFVKPACVIDTGAGELANPPHNVKRIFHVATTKGEIGENLSADLDTLEACVANILEKIEYSGRFRSVLIPMLAAGEGGLPVSVVAPRLIRRAISYFQENPGVTLEKIYFLAYSTVDAEIVKEAMKQFKDDLEPVVETAAAETSAGT